MGGGSSGSPRWVRIFRIGPGSVMKEMSRMSPPHAGHSSGNFSPTRAISLAQAIREVSWPQRDEPVQILTSPPSISKLAA